jgi:phosphoribosylanthranilate isomerase
MTLRKIIKVISSVSEKSTSVNQVLTMNRKVKLKICGMHDSDNILQVAELQPDYMGFIFYAKSKRFVGNEFKIPMQLNRSIKRVGVFVNESTERILELAWLHNLDFVQLHGDEGVDQCWELKNEKLGVIKVFSIDEHFDFVKVEPYKKAVDSFLFDTKSDSYGGTGKTFDWNILTGYDYDVPFFLSGGLSPNNIEEAKNLGNKNLYALDINSGVEISPGLKSKEKLVELINILNS